MDIYNSTDLLQWKKQSHRILEEPGTGAEDQAIGGHADVVVNDDKVYLYYFTHPGRRKDQPAKPGTVDDKRSLIQLALLEYNNGELTCNRNKPVYDKLQPMSKQ